MKDSKSLHNRIAKTVREIPRSGIRDFFDIVSTRKDVISLGIGEPDFVTPWHIRDAASRALDRGQTSYTSNLGLFSLRQSIASYVQQKSGIQYSPDDEVLITVGVSEGLDLAIRALVEPGDEVIYHEPSYVSYNPIIQFAKGVPVAIETKKENGFCITKDDLQGALSSKSKLLLLNYPNNPTGATLSKKEIELIADFVIKNDLIVLTDEIYNELSYNSSHYSIISVPGMRDRTIYLNGFSKSWAMTGWRIGYTCAPPELTDAMMKIHQYTMLCAPILAQEAALEALKLCESDLRLMKKEYNKRRNFMMASFKEMNIPCINPSGAFYAFVDISKYGISSKQFAFDLLEAENVAVVPGTAFGACGEGFIRCSYATSLDRIKLAMQRMKNFTESL